MITGDTWFVQFDKMVYGPYTTDQMNGYIVEGRVTENSWITTNPNHPFRCARDFSNFTPAFYPNMPAPMQALATPPVKTPSMSAPSMPTSNTSLQPSFAPSQYPSDINRQINQTGTQPEGPTPIAPEQYFGRRKNNSFGLDVYELSNPIEQSLTTPAHAQNVPETAEHAPPNTVHSTEPERILDTPVKPTYPVKAPKEDNETVVLIMAELKTDRTMKFLKALQFCGVAERISHSVWLLRTSLSAAKLRNHLSQTIGETDRLFIMDSYNAQTAWFNIGADMDARIRKLWSA